MAPRKFRKTSTCNCLRSFNRRPGLAMPHGVLHLSRTKPQKTTSISRENTLRTAARDFPRGKTGKSGRNFDESNVLKPTHGERCRCDTPSNAASLRSCARSAWSPKQDPRRSPVSGGASSRSVSKVKAHGDGTRAPDDACNRSKCGAVVGAAAVVKQVPWPLARVLGTVNERPEPLTTGSL